jgi:PAS domain S-box-containing protein
MQSLDKKLPFWQSVGARLLVAVVALMIATLVVFTMNLQVLEGIKQQEPALGPRIDGISRLQLLLGGADVVIGGLLIVLIRRVLERERDAAREPRLRAIMNTTSDAVLTIDEKGIVLDVNQMTEKLFGYPAEELLGRNVSKIAASPYREEHDAYMQRYLSTGIPHIIGRGRPVHAQHKDGTVFPVNLRVTEQWGPDGRIFIGILHDLRAETARARLAESTHESVSQLAAASVELLAATSQQAASAEEQVASLTETVATVNEVAQTAEQAAQRVRAVAESSRRVDELGKAGRKAIDDTLEAMEAAREQSESTAESILELAEQAQTIGEIITTVNDIAEQTHLLALNAAIEASRAGEHGRGFSVVAAEVRALAEQSKKATQKVRQILGQIQKATNAAVLGAENGAQRVNATMMAASRAGETIKTLSELLGEAADTALQVAASAGQQATGTAQINQAMRAIEEAVRQNLGSIKQVEQAAADLNALSERLKELLGKLGK